MIPPCSIQADCAGHAAKQVAAAEVDHSRCDNNPRRSLTRSGSMILTLFRYPIAHRSAVDYGPWSMARSWRGRPDYPGR